MNVNVSDSKLHESGDDCIFDYLTEETQAQVLRVGLELLQKHGYDISGCEESERKCKKLCKAMKRRGDLLEYQIFAGKELGTVVVVYVLKRGGVEIDRSPGIKFVFERLEVKDEKGSDS